MLFGVATSDHQFEAYVDQWEDVVDKWEANEQPNGVVPRSTATDFWNRYHDDIRLARGLGCELFRISISWARVEPTEGQFSTANLDHYAELIQEIRDNGMQPVVTLLHGAWPIHIEEAEKGAGLYGALFPERFAAYVQEVTDKIGKDVKYWITINEPDMLPFCYLKLPWSPRFSRAPGLRSGNLLTELDAVAALCNNLFRANALAYDILHERNRDCKVSANPYILGVPRVWHDLTTWGMLPHTHPDFATQPRVGIPHLKLISDAIAAANAGWRDLLESHWVLNGFWWQMGMLGRLGHDLCPAGSEGKQDFVSFDYYWGVSGLEDLDKLPALVDGHYENGPVYPGGLYDLLVFHQELFPGQDIWLAENGCVENADNYSRAGYLESHLAEVKRAVQGGVPVKAYICWSITTNREWGLPARPGTDFGLYKVRFDDPNLEREETDSARTYKRLIQEWHNSP